MKSKIIIFKVNEKENMLLLIINLKIKKRLIEKYFNLLNKKKNLTIDKKHFIDIIFIIFFKIFKKI